MRKFSTSLSTHLDGMQVKAIGLKSSSEAGDFDFAAGMMLAVFQSVGTTDKCMALFENTAKHKGEAGGAVFEYIATYIVRSHCPF